MPTCFWDDCPNETTDTIYFDGKDEPICSTHRPEVEAEVQAILEHIDDSFG